MNGTGDQFLTRSALTLDDHGQGRVGHPVEQVKQVQHARGLPHDLPIVIAQGCCVATLLQLLAHALQSLLLYAQFMLQAPV